MHSTLRQFTYRAVTPNGANVSSTIESRDRNDALLRLNARRLVVLQIEEIKTPTSVSRRRAADISQRVLVLKQLAVMTRAGVDLLEAFDTLASTLPPGQMRDELNATAASLRRGERLSVSSLQQMPGYPGYVHALFAAGEATGQLHHVMALAANELAFDKRTRDEIVNALTYPGVLVAAGTLVLGMLFYTVVPTFADMMKDQRAVIGPVESMIFGIGLGMRAHPFLIAGIFAGALAAIFNLFTNRRLRQRAIERLEKTPFIHGIVTSQRRMNWARVMAIATQAGVNLLDAAQLAANATPNGPFKSKLARAQHDLRSGRTVDEAFSGALELIDTGLLRVGQRTAALGEIFGVIAERHESHFRNSVKRFTTILEPLAIGFVASMIGIVALSLVSAMTSLYDAVG